MTKKTKSNGKSKQSQKTRKKSQSKDKKAFTAIEEGIICGVDPGLEGGLAILTAQYSTQPHLMTYPMPVKNGSVDAYALVGFLHNYKPKMLVIEEMFPGLKTSKNVVGVMGKNWGKVVAIAEALGIPVKVVHSATWQARMLSKRVEAGKTKQRAALAAEIHFPTHCFKYGKKDESHDGMIDAALIALYGKLYLG